MVNVRAQSLMSTPACPARSPTMRAAQPTMPGNSCGQGGAAAAGEVGGGG
jgi:hypothetical protein